jgi:murein DD-endopeptidase MepM/ murein hydrolase activator NlpD
VKMLEPKTGLITKIPVVCARSFFNRTMSQRHKVHRAWTMMAVTLFLVLTLTVVFINSQTGFAVFYNGEQIGNARTINDVTQIVSGAEQQLEEIFGRDVSLDGSITVTADIGVKPDDTKNVTNKILGEIDGVTQMYVIEVNGVAVGASDSETALLDILSAMLNEYSTDTTASVRFVDTVTVSHRFINADITRDPAAIKALLDPKNETSPYALTVENTEQRQFSEVVSYDVQYQNDNTIYEGETAVTTAGVPGENLITENTVYINGTAQTKQVISTTQVKAPVAEVVAMGTAPRPKTASTGSYIWPAEGIISSGFGHRTGFGSSNHQGIDIAGDYGAEIVAADGGEVIRAGWAGGYGQLIEIKHDNGDITYYGHCSKLLVSEGDRVFQGQDIAQMGSTGDSNGVHCHFEIRKSGNPVNPVKYLP